MQKDGKLCEGDLFYALYQQVVPGGKYFFNLFFKHLLWVHELR